MAAQQIGIVTTVVGHVVAVNADGVERVLVVGDVVYADEVIRTADAGAVTIQFNDGGWFDLGGNAQAVLDSDVYSQEGPEAEAAGAVARVEDIQAAIEAGGDPTQLLPPTAAGAAAGGAGGEDGGHSFVVLNHDFNAINPDAGIPTAADPLLFSGVERIIVPVEPEPVIAVSVEVDVTIGGGEPGEGGIVLIPGGTPITGGVSGANVIEGSNGSSHQVTFLITLSQVVSTPVTVTYTIVPVSATNPDDYFDGAQTGTVTIPAGYIGFTVTENIVSDILVEGNETFQIVLSNPIGATLTNDTATVTIIDDDMNPVANDDTNWVQEDNLVGESEDESETVTASGNVLQSIAHPGDPSPTLGFADAADVDDNPLILTWGAETAVYGNIVKNADGSYVYQLNNDNPVIQGLSAGETLAETFTYTITDGVNTPDTATLTITIFGADDGVTITGIGSTQGDETVFENDLPAGSSSDAGALTQTGSFNIVALDGIATVNVGGTLLTLAQLQNLGTTPAIINTTYGALTLTGYTGNSQGGTVSYSYTLDTTVDNDSQAGATGTGFMESVSVTVTDEDGSSDTSAVTINIVDDAPTANVDGPVGVTEDGTSSVDGNVLSNDTSGADAPGVFVGWSAGDTAAIAGLNTYGTLTQNSDGTWSYVLDNSLAATQALTSASNLSYTLNYTMADADGDTSSSTLTITITGADDGASVVTAAASGPDATVYESGLNPDGSNAAANTETITGTFTVSATDGIANVVIGGTVFTLAQVQAFATTNGVVDTGQGVLTLTGYSGTATSGTINYSYTLSATIDNDSITPTSPDAVTAEHFDDSVALTVNGVGGTTASDDLVIRIVDDAPTANVDGPVGVTEDGTSSVDGNVLSNDTSGADAPGVFVGWSAGDTAAIAGLNTYGTLTQNSDGTWSYVLDNSLAATQALTSASNLSYTLNYTMADADGDTSSSTLTITITGADDGASVVTAAASGPDATVYESGLNPDGSNAAANTETITGTFTVSATDGIANVVIGGTVFTLAQVQAFATTNGVVDTGQGVLTLTGYSGTATSGTINYSYTLSATIDNDSITPTSPDAVTAEHFDDSVALTVNGVGGTTASDDLVIRIVDDAPTANVDGPVGVTEDGTSSVDGNVLSNDTSGADAPGVFVGWSAGDTAAIAGLNTYGTLTQNSDGTWSYVLDNSLAATQALTSASNLSYTLNYTMADADGDTSSSTLTITITGADDGASVVTAAASGPDATVYESGLNPDGSNAAANTETITGTFTVSATDGIANVVIGGTVFTLAQVQAFATTNGVVDTGQGVLTLTGYSGTATSGTINYSYTLSATIDNDSITPTSPDAVTAEHFDDSVALTVNGVGGTTASDDLVIRIVDDAPTANVDGPVGVTEDGTSSVDGNVLSNDTSGADAPGVFVGWSAGDTAAIAGLNTYGTLTQNSDGTWSYVLDNSLAATQALTSASNLSYTLNYTMADADGDTSSSTLTITITGADDGASVVTAAASGPDATVYESGLNPDGSNAAANTETITGTFTVSATDGIANVVIGGTVFTLAQVQAFATTNGVVDTGQGVLTLTGYSGTATSGTINYSYTLSATIDNDSITPTSPDAVTAEHFDDSVALTVNGVGGTTASDDLVIRAVDDVPVLNVTDGIAVNQVGTALFGTVATIGADAPGTVTFVGTPTPPEGLTSGGELVTYEVSLDGSTLTAKAGGTTVFTLELNADGTYEFNLLAPLDLSQTVPLFSGGVNASGPQDAYFFSAAGGFSTTPPTEWAVEITGSGGGGGNADKVNSTSQAGGGIGVGNAQLDAGEIMTLEFDDEGADGEEDTITRATIGIAAIGGGAFSVAATVFYADGTSEVVLRSAEGEFTVGDGSKEIDYITLEATSGDVRISSLAVDITDDSAIQNLAFDVLAVDADGDSVTTTLDVLVQNSPDITGDSTNNALGGGDGPSTLVGGAGDEILTGGGGDDILTGGDGSDRFVFESAHLGDGVDAITDFTLGTPVSGGDVLDISDLLAGAGITPVQFAGNAGDYLVVATSGTDTTIAFDANGGDHADAVQIATLQNVNTTLATLIGNGQIDSTV